MGVEGMGSKSRGGTEVQDARRVGAVALAMAQIEDQIGQEETKPRRVASLRGQTMIEFTLTMFPFLAMVLFLVWLCWLIWAKATLQQATRDAVRLGITITGSQATQYYNGYDLTTIVKNTVVANSWGLLPATKPGATPTKLIRVNYYQPPAATAPAGTMPTLANTPGGKVIPGNIIQVSIEGFSIIPLVPLIFNGTVIPQSPLTLAPSVSADLIEPSKDPPNIGNPP